MKHLHWWTLVIGYLLGSFFGVMSVLGLFGKGKKQQAPAASS